MSATAGERVHGSVPFGTCVLMQLIDHTGSVGDRWLNENTLAGSVLISCGKVELMEERGH